MQTDDETVGSLAIEDGNWILKTPSQIDGDGNRSPSQKARLDAWGRGLRVGAARASGCVEHAVRRGTIRALPYPVFQAMCHNPTFDGPL